MARSNLDLIRRGWEAASRGSVEEVAELLAEDVRWHGAGDDHGGCQNREQALRWMRDGIARGVNVDLLDAREAGQDRVVTILQRRQPLEGNGELPEPHAQIIQIREGKITEMVVYPSADDALSAAGLS